MGADPSLFVVGASLGVVAGYGAAIAAAQLQAGASQVSRIGLCAVAAVLFAWAVLVMPPDWRLVLTWVLATALLVLAVVDLLAFRLPDLLTLPLIVAGLAGAAAHSPHSFGDHLIGAMGGYAAFAGIAWSYERLRGRAGLGIGDAKLLAAAGAWLGWQGLPSVVLVGCVAAILMLTARAAFRGRETLAQPLPFGAPLCFAFWLTWLHGPIGGGFG